MKIISTKGSSAQYGKCEKCGKHCTEVFHFFGFDGKKYHDLFGCLECCQKAKEENE